MAQHQTSQDTCTENTWHSEFSFAFFLGGRWWGLRINEFGLCLVELVLMPLTSVITTVILVARCTNMVQPLCVVSYLHSKVLKVRMVLDNEDSNYGICLMFRYESYKKTQVSA